VNPWIHVSSDVQNLRRAHAGERLEARAGVLDLFEKNGHAYVDLDLDLDVAVLAPSATSAENVPVLRAKHRAIYCPRAVR